MTQGSILCLPERVRMPQVSLDGDLGTVRA
jgi:hypothetical protein